MDMKTKYFEIGDKVIVVFPTAPEDGQVVEIVAPMGPVMMKILGFPCLFPQSYLVNVPGLGSIDEYGNKIVYPSDFLHYAKPDVKFERSTWLDFDKMVQELNETTSSNVIKNGVQSNNGQEM